MQIVAGGVGGVKWNSDRPQRHKPTDTNTKRRNPERKNKMEMDYSGDSSVCDSIIWKLGLVCEAAKLDSEY